MKHGGRHRAHSLGCCQPSEAVRMLGSIQQALALPAVHCRCCCSNSCRCRCSHSLASLRLQLAVELEHAQAGAHAAQLAHKLGKLLDAVRLVRQQVALCRGAGRKERKIRGDAERPTRLGGQRRIRSLRVACTDARLHVAICSRRPPASCGKRRSSSWAPAACCPQTCAACPQQQCAVFSQTPAHTCTMQHKKEGDFPSPNKRGTVVTIDNCYPLTHKVAHLAVAVLLRHLVQRAQLLRLRFGIKQGIVGGRRQGRNAGRRAGGRAARGEAGRRGQCNGTLSNWCFGTLLATSWPPTIQLARHPFFNHWRVWGSKKRTWKLSFSSDRASSNAYSASPAAGVVLAVVGSVEGRGAAVTAKPFQTRSSIDSSSST